MRARRAAAAAVWIVVGASLLAPPGWAPSFRQPLPGGSAVVALGDSVPAGTACHCTPFPDLYAGLVTPGDQAVNLAHNGYTSADVRRQVGAAGLRAPLAAADVVLIMVGANDMAGVFTGSRDTASYQAVAARIDDDVAATVRRIRAIHSGPQPAHVLVFGYWNVVEDGAVGRSDYDRDGLAAAETATRYANGALQAAARRVTAVYVPTYPAFKGADGSIDPTDLLAGDGDHPSARGHELIAQAAYAILPNG
jgi:lysophospholipase L1-like esterase